MLSAWPKRGSILLCVPRLLDAGHRLSPIASQLSASAKSRPSLGSAHSRGPTSAAMSRFFLIHTVTSAALSFFKYAEWVAVVTAFATAATSWVDFNGYVRKLNSFTSTVRALESHVAWWKSLSDSQKAGTVANDKLVEMGEQFILATRFSRILALQEKKVEDVGDDGAASGKAITIEGAASGKASTPGGASSGRAATQANQLAEPSAGLRV